MRGSQSRLEPTLIMNQARVYLDFNATAPLLPAARLAMIDALDAVGNASSVHLEGRALRARMERARESVGALVGARAGDVAFTSGGTEAANLALTPHLHVAGDKRPFELLILSAGEHACMLQGHRFAPETVRLAPLRVDGTIDLDALEAMIGARRVTLALQLANNETGVLQPVAAAAALAHRHGGFVVCDAAQAAGRIPVDMRALDADALIVSAHKFGGPKGAGALILDQDRAHIAAPLVAGGGQERGWRAGTENVAAIAGFGAAALEAARECAGQALQLAAWRDRLQRGVLEIDPAAAIFGQGAARLPNTLAFALPGLSAETMLIALDLAGFAISSGSACSSGKVKRSHVLAAMGVDEALAQGALRVSLGWSTRADEIDAFLAALAAIVARVRGRRARMAA